MEHILVVCNDIADTEKRLRERYGFSGKFCDYHEVMAEAREGGYHIMVVYNKQEASFTDTREIENRGLEVLEKLRKKNRFLPDSKSMPKYIILIGDPEDEELIARAGELGVEKVTTEKFLASLSSYFRKEETPKPYLGEEEIIVADVLEEPEDPEIALYKDDPEEEGEETKDLTEIVEAVREEVSEKDDTTLMETVKPPEEEEDPSKRSTRKMLPGEYPD